MSKTTKAFLIIAAVVIGLVVAVVIPAMVD